MKTDSGRTGEIMVNGKSAGFIGEVESTFFAMECKNACFSC